MKTGKEPLRTFSDLMQFFQQKTAVPEESKPEAALPPVAEPAPVQETPPVANEPMADKPVVSEPVVIEVPAAGSQASAEPSETVDGV